MLIAMLVFVAPALAASRVERIRARGYLLCGVATTVPGFASVDPNGRVVGFEPDLCRAIAAAILGRDGEVRYVPTQSVRTFVAARAPDLVARRLTVSLRRDREPGLAFSPVVFYDGTALMVRANAGIGAVSELAGRRICVVAHAATETALASFFGVRPMALDALPAPRLEDASQAFLRGDCEALAADLSELAATRARFPDPHAFAMLPGLLSKEPLALLLHRDDAQFAAVVKWTIYALIAAEELGVTQASVANPATSANCANSGDPAVRRLLGCDPGNGAALGLDERWAANAIASAGNYGEIYARHLGSETPLRLERGQNALWRDGGLMYALPLR
jgi:general L-amino acid transport system substrate-binding protein